MKYQDIILRAPQPGDIDILYEWENNPEVWKVSGTVEPFSRNDIRKHIREASKSIYESRQARFMICLAADETPVGTIDLFDFDPFNLRAGVGILIADQCHRRKGYARMALKAITDWSFNYLKIHQLYCNIMAENSASIALFEEAGFSLSGTRRDWYRGSSGYSDELFYQLISV